MERMNNNPSMLWRLSLVENVRTFFLRKEPKYWMKVYSHALYNGPTYWKMENIET